MVTQRLACAHARTVLTSLGLLLVLGGCSMLDGTAMIPRDRSDVAEAYPVGAELQRASLDVMGFSGYGPESSAQYFNTVRFVRTYAQDGRGPLRVAAPPNGAARDVELVRRIIRANGLASHQVQMLRRRDGVAAVTLSYDRIAAVAPTHCYEPVPGPERRPELDSGTSFGCASQRNLAGMVADPSDLVVAAPEPDRGSERRAALHKAYRDTVDKGHQ